MALAGEEAQKTMVAGDRKRERRGWGEERREIVLTCGAYRHVASTSAKPPRKTAR
jgi:hypothetical protein